MTEEQKKYFEKGVKKERKRILDLFYPIDLKRNGISEHSIAETYSTKLEAFDYGQDQYRKDMIDLINQD